MELVDEQSDRWTDNGQVGEFFNAHQKFTVFRNCPSGTDSASTAP